MWSTPVVIFSSSKNGTVYNSRNLFAVTVHELAHVSHWRIGYNTTQYLIDHFTEGAYLPESWATGVEYTVTNRVYPSGGDYDFPYNFNKQYWTLERIKSESEGYTPIVIDMIDTENQYLTWGSTRPNDRVHGYTLKQLEDALPGAFGSWWSWRTRIRSMYNNPTENEELDYLFREYR